MINSRHREEHCQASTVAMRKISRFENTSAKSSNIY